MYAGSTQTTPTMFQNLGSRGEPGILHTTASSAPRGHWETAWALVPTVLRQQSPNLSDPTAEVPHFNQLHHDVVKGDAGAEPLRILG